MVIDSNLIGLLIFNTKQKDEKTTALTPLAPVYNGCRTKLANERKEKKPQLSPWLFMPLRK